MSVFIVERMREDGRGTAIGLGRENGTPGYARNYREACWFARKRDAQKFLLHVRGMKAIPNMTNEFRVIEHPVGD